MIRDYALAAARRGWPVFPVREHGKVPVGRWTEEATTDEETVAAWPDDTRLNYGIACGPAGLVVVDEDEPGAADRIAAACGYDRLPATFTVNTGKGRHLYYRANGTPVRNGVRKMPGIDVRAEGGYVVGPGSTHATGARYEVADGRETLPLPRWLAEALNDGVRAPEGSPRAPGEVVTPELRAADEAIPTRIEAGTRRKTILRRAGSMRTRGATLDEALVVARYLHQRCDQPPGEEFTWEEAANTVRDVFTRYDGPEADPSLATVTPEEIEREARKLRLQHAARDKVAAEKATTVQLPEPVRLDEFLAAPDEDTTHRIAGLWPTGGRVVLAAANKSGKTVLAGNTIRALADGEPFLGRFAVTRAARVVLIDNELDERMLRRWLRDMRIVTQSAVELVSLRGRLSSFNILDPTIRGRWAGLIGPGDVLLFDCLRPALDALGLSEDKDAGRFLEALDELTAAAGIDETLIVHHMGHHGERSRGDSRILDWPDAKWRLVRERGENGEEPAEDARRYFTAYGRDVDQPEVLLDYNSATRRLIAIGGSRAEQRLAGIAEAITAYLADSPGASKNAIEEAVGHRRDDVREALTGLVRTGEVSRVKRGSAHLHTLNLARSPTLAQRTGEQGARNLAPSPIGRGRGEHATENRHNDEPRPGEVQQLLADQLGATPIDAQEDQ